MNFQQSQSPPEWWHFLHLGFNYKVPGGTVTIKLSQGIARTISFGSTTTNMWTWRKTMTWQTHQPTNKKSSSNLLQMTNHFSLETNQTKTCWARGKRVGLGGDSCSQKCKRAATGWGGVNPRFSPIWATATKPTRDIPVKSWLVHDGIPIFVAYYNPQIGCENSNPINKEAKSPILAIFIAFYLIFPYNTRAPKISGTPPNWWNPKPPSTSYQVTVAWSFQTATIVGTRYANLVAKQPWDGRCGLGGWGCAGFTRQRHRKKKILKRGFSLQNLMDHFCWKLA